MARPVRLPRALLFALWLLPASFAGRLEAVNALPNGEFDAAGQLDGWGLGFGQFLNWSGEDSTGCVGSGALWGASSPMSVAGDSRRNRFLTWTSVCLQIGPGEPIHFAMSYRTEATTTRALLYTFSTPDCSGGPGFYQAAFPAASEWSRVAWTKANTLNAQSVSLLIEAWNLVADAAFEVELDRVYLGLEPEIFLDGFESGYENPACRWNAVAP